MKTKQHLKEIVNIFNNTVKMEELIKLYGFDEEEALILFGELFEEE